MQRKLLGMAVACLALLPGVALAQQAAPDLEQAMAARAAGDHARAIQLLEGARLRSPNDATVLRLLGTSYAFNRQYPQAIAVLEQAHAAYPADQDIALALARAYLWSGRHDDAQAIAVQIARADPATAELPALRQSIDRALTGATTEPASAETRRRTIVALSQGYWDVSAHGASRDWYDTGIAVAAPVGRNTMIGMAVNREDRAGIVDTRMELRVDQRFSQTAAGYLAVAMTPNADFRERWSLRAGGEARVQDLLTLTLDGRYADYRITEVVVAEPGVRLHTPDDRAALAVKMINLWDDGTHRSGWSARGEYQLAPAFRINGGGATYPDTEAGITRRVHSWFVGGAYDLNDTLSLRATYEHTRRVSSYTSDGVVVTLMGRF